MQDLDEEKIKRAIVVAGNYRSGTTWLAEMLTRGLPHYALLFEPIRAYYLTMQRAGVVQWRPYITDDNADEKVLEAFRQVLSGRMVERDTLARTDAQAVRHAQGLVVKLVRGLMCLRWLVDTFEPRHTFVIIRHPCAAISSQLRVDAAKGTPLDAEELDAFFARHPEVEPFVPRGPVTRLAFWWAASYQEALSTPKPHPWTLLRYEDLHNNPRGVERAVFGNLGVVSHVPYRDLTEKLSMTSRQWSDPIVMPPWQAYLGERARLVWAVVERFDTLRGLYAP